MGRLRSFLAVILTALVLGAGSAGAAVFSVYRLVDVANGSWRTIPVTGSTDADMYTRALIAIVGVLALDRSETVYFSATEDSSGERLSAACDYMIAGDDLASRWWSLTAYGEDGYLIDNELDRYSFARDELVGPQGRWTVRLSGSPQEGNWLPTGDEERVDLLLRFYNPSPELYDNLGTVALPSITRLGCR